MEAKHTPGPWRVEGRYKIVRDSPFPLPRIVVQTTISGECNHSINMGDDSDAANARLIAAAPDLLVALEDAVKIYKQEIKDAGSCEHDTGHCVCYLRTALGNAEEAIAKTKEPQP